jgi:GDP-L-fucose synthase
LNILITGRNGFIGRELEQFLSDTSHNVIATCRMTLDVSDEAQVRSFLEGHDIDVVLHAAILGGRRKEPDTFFDFVDNLSMFKNLVKHSEKYDFMISFGSGAEAHADTYYGSAKSIIASEILKSRNLVNLRLFGCFGPTENDNRFIKNSFNRLSRNEPILIYQDRHMDFFYIDDLKKVVLYYIENFYKGKLPGTIDLCYEGKKTLLEVANEIKYLTSGEVPIIIKNKNPAVSYTGDGAKLTKLGLKLHGFHVGIRKTIEELRMIENG